MRSRNVRTSRTSSARVEILGVAVAAEPVTAQLAEIKAMLAGPGGYVCVANTHTLIEASRNPSMRDAKRHAALVVPDGRPLLWCARFAGGRQSEQLRGVDLFRQLNHWAAESDIPVFLLGGTSELLATVRGRLARELPGLNIAGAHSPPFAAVEDMDLDQQAREIQESDARIVWVGLGAPKQELWMHAVAPRLPGRVLVGVGAAFDFAAGSRSEAPRFLQRVGLEWAFRLAQEPRRLAGRYASTVPAFMWEVVKNPPRLLSTVESNTS